jgi:Domain of unknown function (DUF4249)
MRYLICILIFSIAFIACQKDVDPELPPFEEQLVVDGGIYKNEVAKVKLSNSFDYFGKFDSATVFGKIITDAVVTISDGENTERLNLLPILYKNKVIDIAYMGNPITGIKGQVGKTYTLKIEYRNQTYTALSTMLPAVTLDSAWFDFKKRGDNNEELGFLKVKFFEPEPLGDFYRSFTKRISKDSVFLTYFNSVFEDKFINGISFELNYTRPLPANSKAAEDDDYRRRHYDINDTVVLNFCKIGRKEFDYFSSVANNISANGNPFSTPYNILSNISNNGIGIFCAYGSRIDTIVLKKGKKFKAP